MDQATEQRHHWAIAQRRGRVGDTNLSLLDPDDEDDLFYFMLAEHVELIPAIEDELDVVEMERVVMNPRLHLIMHQIVASQLLNNQPPEVWETAKRLMSIGYKRHEILHMLGSAISEQIWTTMTKERPPEPGSYLAALKALPESWESMRDQESGLLQ